MILTIIFTILSAAYDTKKRFTNHIPRFVFRAITVFGISYFTCTSFWLNTAIFYLIFDYLLNILEGREWNYIGDTAIHDVMWLIYLGGWVPQLLFKIGLIILFKNIIP